MEEKIPKLKMKLFYSKNQAKPEHRLYKILKNYSTLFWALKMLKK
jgi:hypothetical protein